MLKNKELQQIKLAAKTLKDPIDKGPGSMWNSWRSKLYTKKGRLAGFPDSWRTFEGFQKNIPDGWEHGKILMRYDTSKPYSKDNCYWGDRGEEHNGKLIKLTYNGETKTIAEWCLQYNLNYNGVRQRYFKGKNYTIEEVLFGKFIASTKFIKSISELDSEQQKKDKISKMLSSYKCEDKKHGREFDITREFMYDVVYNQKCTYCGDTENLGLDRIDNTKGHTLDNVVPCCYECNIARGNNFTYEEMLEIGKTIRLIKERRKNGNSSKKNCEET